MILTLENANIAKRIMIGNISSIINIFLSRIYVLSFLVERFFS